MSEENARPLGNVHAQNLIDQTGAIVSVSDLANPGRLQVSPSGIESQERSLSDWTLSVYENTETINNIGRFEKDFFYSKSITTVLPLRWPDASSAESSIGYSQNSPQGFAYDDDGNVFLHYPSGSYSAIVVYGPENEYVSWFAVSSGGESLVVRGSLSGGTLVLYKRHSDATLHRYDISAMPENGEVLTSSQEVISSSVGLQFSYNQGVWMVEQNSPDLGVDGSRTAWNKYDEDFNFVGAVYVNRSIVGWQLPVSTFYENVPKTQGVLWLNGALYFSLGGLYYPDQDGAVAPVMSHVGLAKVSPDGSLIDYSVVDSNKLLDKLNADGYQTNRTENEGIARHPDGSIRTLFININTLNADNVNRGIIIFREMDYKGQSYKELASTYSPYNWDRLTSAIAPRGPSGELNNPFTGQPFTTMSEVLDFMVEAQVPELSWYTGAVDITFLPDLDYLEGNYVANILNVNNQLMHIRLDGTTSDPWFSGYEFRALKEGGEWRALQVSDAAFYMRLGGRPSLDATTTIGRITVPHSNASEEDILAFQATSSGSSSQIVFGGSSTLYNCATVQKFYCASGISNTTGVQCLELFNDYVSPGRDNAVNLGTSGSRWSAVYAATGTISTSDAREKTEVRDFRSAEVEASKQLAKEIGFYKFLSAVEEKGDSAREHCGMTVQRVIEIMESHGLDPMSYSFICYDEWEGDEGNGLDSGDIYSFREGGLHAFILRGMEARLSAIEEK